MSKTAYIDAHKPGVVNYNSVLSHFKDQAQGRGKMKLIKNPPANGRARHGVVLLAASIELDKKHGKGDIPPVAVVDPTEADRKRALGLLENQEKSGSSAEKKIRSAKSAIEASVKKSPKLRKPSSKKKPGKVSKTKHKPPKKPVSKRRRDIFD
jgi:hypothetical protein